MCGRVPVMPLRHEITDRWPAVLVLWHDQLLRLEGTRERSLLRRSRLPDQRKSRNWHPEILSKHAALQPTRSFALSRASKSASYNFQAPTSMSATWPPEGRLGSCLTNTRAVSGSQASNHRSPLALR
jgi:hypothetical protein